jgi:hypothetical protein
VEEPEELSTEEIDAGAGGRPAFEPTPEQRTWVLEAASKGLPQKILVLGVQNPHTNEPIALKTLRKHFRDQLNQGLTGMGMLLLNPAFEVAVDKDHPGFMQMNTFFQKTRLGQKETTVSEIVGADGETLGVPQLLVFGGNVDGLPSVAFEDVEEDPSEPE